MITKAARKYVPRKQLATKAARKKCYHVMPPSMNRDTEEDDMDPDTEEEPSSGGEQSESSLSEDGSYDSDGDKFAGKETQEELMSNMEVACLTTMGSSCQRN